MQSSKQESSLAHRVEQLSKVLEDQQRLIEDSSSVLQGASGLLKTVRQRYEPVKAQSWLLSNIVNHATSCHTDISRLLSCLKVHDKLDRSWQQQAADGNLDNILAALEEVVDANAFLAQYTDLDIAVAALVKNRESIAHATNAVASTFERMIKVHTCTPARPALEHILSQPRNAQPKATEVFFPSKKTEVRAMRNILHAMLHANEHGCLSVYVKSRQQGVAALLQHISDDAGPGAPAGEQQERRLNEWTSRMRVLALAHNWEAELARVLLPGEVKAQAVERVLAGACDAAIDAGHTLCSNRIVDGRFPPVLDMIVCMLDQQLDQHGKFAPLLAALYAAAKQFVEGFAAALAADAAPARREASNPTSVSLQTAFVLRFLKSLFRRELRDRLPFLTKPRAFATDVLAVHLKLLESRAAAAIKEHAGVAVAMLNNAHYLVAGVAEHDQLPTVLGEAWLKYHRDIVLPHWRAEYRAATWDALVLLMQAAQLDARPDVKKDAVKEHFKRINARIEKVHATQCGWAMPDAALRSQVSQFVVDSVLPKYTQLWRACQQLEVYRTSQKHFKYSPEDLAQIISVDLLSGATTKKSKK